MTDKQTELRQRLAAVLADMQANGRNDGEAMFMLGKLATSTADLANAASWTALKPRLSKQDFARLFTMIADEGEQFVSEGKTKQAYVLQALAISLVAAQENDPVLTEGAALLDAMIDQAVVNYRKHAQAPIHKAN